MYRHVELMEIFYFQSFLCRIGLLSHVLQTIYPDVEEPKEFVYVDFDDDAMCPPKIKETTTAELSKALNFRVIQRRERQRRNRRYRSLERERARKGRYECPMQCSPKGMTHSEETELREGRISISGGVCTFLGAEHTGRIGDPYHDGNTTRGFIVNNQQRQHDNVTHTIYDSGEWAKPSRGPLPQKSQPPTTATNKTTNATILPVRGTNDHGMTATPSISHHKVKSVSRSASLASTNHEKFMFVFANSESPLSEALSPLSEALTHHDVDAVKERSKLSVALNASQQTATRCMCMKPIIATRMHSKEHNITIYNPCSSSTSTSERYMYLSLIHI